MPKNDNAHALRLAANLSAHIGEDASRAFSEAHPLSKSADVQQKFAWARAVCEYLDGQYDEETIRLIRRDCRCNDGKSIADKLLRYLKSTDSLAQFADSFNRGETFAQMEYLSENALHFIYPACYCACVKRADGDLSRAWCACTLGNAEAIFTRVFGPSVQVSLLESIKTGGTRCVIRVEW